MAKQVMPVRKVQALLAEYIGTMFLTMVLILSGARLSSTPGLDVPGGLPIGLTLAALIYSFDHVSGAQFNPAVTLGMVLTRKMRLGTAVLYIAAQTLGGASGALLATAIASPKNVVPFIPTASTGAAWAVEFLFTFALVLVQQNAGAEKNAREPNSYFGLAVSFLVLAGACATGPVSGGCFNPAVGTGLDFASMVSASSTTTSGVSMLWLYWTAPLAGALVASAVKTYQNLPSHAEAAGLPPVVPLTEMIGTFFLVLTACLAHEGLAIGAMCLAMVYMGDHVAGCDFNPAVTVGVALRMGVPVREWWKVGVTIAAQFVGAIAAAFTAYGVLGSVTLPTGEIKGVAGALVFEAAWTMLLVYVVCAVMTPTHGDDDPAVLEERRGHSRSYQGLAIGWCLSGGVYAAGVNGGASGGVFNPALGSAVAIAQAAYGDSKAQPDKAWLFIVGPFVGSLLGAGLFSLLHFHNDPAVLDYIEDTAGNGEEGVEDAGTSFY